MTEDRALTSLQMLGVLSSGSAAITAVPIADARLVEHAVPEVTAISLDDAAPSEICVTWRREGANPLVEVLVAVLRAGARADGV
jgi:hypothetical protein